MDPERHQVQGKPPMNRLKKKPSWRVWRVGGFMSASLISTEAGKTRGPRTIWQQTIAGSGGLH